MILTELLLVLRLTFLAVTAVGAAGNQYNLRLRRMLRPRYLGTRYRRIGYVGGMLSRNEQNRDSVLVIMDEESGAMG